MARYKVMGGNHQHFDGKTYKKDDIIECDVDLSKMFVNKFQKVSVDVSITEAVPVPKPPVTKPEPITEEIPTLPPVEPKESITKKKTEKINRGKDVTTRFPKAIDEDYLVFQKNRRHFVYDAEEPGEALNDEGLKKPEVEKFISKLVED